MDTKRAIKFLEECQDDNVELQEKGYDEELIKVIELLQYNEKLKEDLVQFIEKENPYPEDVFLVIKKEDFVKINNFFKKELGYPMDRLSGNIGRRIYKTIIEDLKKVIR